ncbi:hypothetical protein MMC19_004297 [Ptychographa xylographoides]|nr:hypothetical protein [Ptychographa xylographoides]
MAKTIVPSSSTCEHEFQARLSKHHKKRMESIEDEEGNLGKYLEAKYAGVAAAVDGEMIKIGLSTNDATYSTDFAVLGIEGANESKKRRAQLIANFLIETLLKYQTEHLCKFLGVGVTESLYQNLSPQLPSKLWAELDVVPMVFKIGTSYPGLGSLEQTVDEQADSMARKCIMYFGPIQQPRLVVGFRNEVAVDSDGHAVITDLASYKDTVGDRTWSAVLKYAKDLRGRKTKIAFFNSTPQGGGVALMRHALVRFLRLLEIDIKWYVPRPRPEVFRITKTNHNILQGVNNSGEYLSKDQQNTINEWIEDNANRYWLHDGGPMAARSKGGADVIFIDDPQMPGLIPLCKKADPEREILYRSHIQIRSDLVAKAGSEARGVWDYLWDNIKHADLFISHPVSSFVPGMVPKEMVGYMPATTDWLDGLNKKLSSWASGYQMYDYNLQCDGRKIPKITFPARDYVIQVARFDPAKGIPDLVRSYGILRQRYMKDIPSDKAPQLVICGHGAIDDPDATIIYDRTMDQIEKDYPTLKDDISVMRLGPIDQELNVLLSNAKVACQMSTREGFEVKVSEAIHKGIPVIATTAGGIPLQVQHGKNGFLVEPGDSEAVAKHLYELLTDKVLHKRMSRYAATSVSDEVSTVGNALSWLYLATVMSKGEAVKPNGKWINDMARQAAGEPYEEGENRLPRDRTT